MAFKGMNPEEGREIATAISEAGQKIMEIVGDMTPVVNGVEWVGADYDTYREEWNTFMGGPVANLVNGLQEKGKALETHAEQQDTTSNQG
ncbi:hypothetical protein CFK38_08200 [Brachybacterium vulturis]|uniref:WXG100 family type VII secretion target n=1 Tax=Brachybacterium vulturis TaxID=2017484 RepID=A0A291GLX8_9MICO|nr:hypothetical protein [Brachybacterium vulturis]ATG51512.1 hypothetical protein CFK38_08190 [Brachybacterium vulturis]ATG51513.1 hypothetical protein CFK38_08200 [Brachybacterium vulturis]